MRRPDLFIIGAPKCGTTSLASWLGKHPRIFMTAIKEPHYFNFDHPGYVPIRSVASYEAHFRGARVDHGAVGEASVWYLYSEVAVPEILKYSPDARFIVCLRDPVDMALSLYRQKLFSCDEHLTDFAEAWELRTDRWEGRCVTKWCREPRHLAYDRACMLGEQLERLYDRVKRNRVHTVLLEDLGRDPRGAYRRVLDFLSLPDDGRSDFPTLNSAKEFRFTALQRLIRIGATARRRLRLTSFGFGKLNRREPRNSPLSDGLRRELAACFAKDVAKLGRLLGRDLSHWGRC
jgi:hypothetical protein